MKQEKHAPPSVQGHAPTQLSRCGPSSWNRDMSPQPWGLKPVVYWCCQSPFSDQYQLPQMGLQQAESKLRSGYVEGYGVSADMKCLRDCNHLLHLSLKFIFKFTCDEAVEVGMRVTRKCTNISRRASWKKWIVWLPLKSLGSMLFLSFPVFQIHLRGPLYGCMLFLLFLIKRKYWCLSDPLIGAKEKFMRCVFSIEAAFELSLT